MTFQGRFDRLITSNTNLPALVMQDGVRVNGELVKQYVIFLLKPDQATRLSTVCPGSELEVEAQGIGIVPESLNIGWS
ncbi:MAG: hypothetical protein JWP00_4174 [Chloroflexi bacterium]|nr:hypothetical protein [Chloroflexota bacterium]